MKRLLPLVLILATLVGTFGCKGKTPKQANEVTSGQRSDERYYSYGGTAEEAKPAAATRGEKSDIDRTVSGTSEVSDLNLPISRMVIKTGSLGIRVKDVDKAYSQALMLIEAKGGYVQSGTLSESGGARADLTIKVNPEGFISLVSALEELGTVENKTISGQDVTEEYYDLAAELETQLEMKARFFELLKQARNVDEAITVEQQLERIGYNVNRIKGRMKYLETMVGESTITLSLYSQTKAVSEPFINWNQVGHGFVVAGQVLVSIFVGILYALVVIIPLGGIAYLIFLLIRGIVRKQKAKKAKG